MATCIQSCWRGYSSRKYTHDFYARKQYIQRILQTNKKLRKVLQGAELQARKYKEQEAQERQEELIKKEMLRLHHTTSTESTPGILPTASLTLPKHVHITMSETKIRSHNKATIAKVFDVSLSMIEPSELSRNWLREEFSQGRRDMHWIEVPYESQVHLILSKRSSNWRGEYHENLSLGFMGIHSRQLPEHLSSTVNLTNGLRNENRILQRLTQTKLIHWINS